MCLRICVAKRAGVDVGVSHDRNFHREGGEDEVLEGRVQGGWCLCVRCGFVESGGGGVLNVTSIIPRTSACGSLTP